MSLIPLNWRPGQQAPYAEGYIRVREADKKCGQKN